MGRAFFRGLGEHCPWEGVDKPGPLTPAAIWVFCRWIISSFVLMSLAIPSAMYPVREPTSNRISGRSKPEPLAKQEWVQGVRRVSCLCHGVLLWWESPWGERHSHPAFWRHPAGCAISARSPAPRLDFQLAASVRYLKILDTFLKRGMDVWLIPALCAGSHSTLTSFEPSLHTANSEVDGDGC